MYMHMHMYETHLRPRTQGGHRIERDGEGVVAPPESTASSRCIPQLSIRLCRRRIVREVDDRQEARRVGTRRVGTRRVGSGGLAGRTTHAVRAGAGDRACIRELRETRSSSPGGLGSRGHLFVKRAQSGLHAARTLAGGRPSGSEDGRDLGGGAGAIRCQAAAQFGRQARDVRGERRRRSGRHLRPESHAQASAPKPRRSRVEQHARGGVGRRIVHAQLHRGGKGDEHRSRVDVLRDNQAAHGERVRDGERARYVRAV